jgi:hypothetical protein
MGKAMLPVLALSAMARPCVSCASILFRPSRQPTERDDSPMDTPPYFSPDQLDYLNKVFPDRCAQKGMTVEDIWRAAVLNPSAP